MISRKILKFLGIGIAGIFTIIIVTLLALEFFVSDAYVARMVTKYSAQMLNAQMQVEEIGFTAFSHFPSVGVRLKNGTIVSNTHLKDSVQYDRTPKQADTLVSFNEFTVLINPLRMLKGRIDISGIILDNPRAYAYVSPTGCANWDIMVADTTATAEVDTVSQESSQESPLHINIRNIEITGGGRFVYDSREEGLRASLFMNSVILKGNFSDEIEKSRIRKGNFSRLNMAVSQSGAQKYFEGIIADTASGPGKGRASMRFAIDTLNIESAGKGLLAVEARTRTNVRVSRNSLTENLPMDIKGKIKLGGRRESALTFQDLKITTAGIPLNLNGKVEYSADSLYTENFLARIEEFPLEEFLQYVPKAIVPDISKLHTDTRLSVDVNVFGSYDFSSGKLPNADVDFNIPSSSIAFDGIKEKIKEVYLNGKYHFRPSIPDSNMVVINKMLVDGDGIALYGKGYVKNIERNPYIDIYMNSRVNLDSLVKMFPPETDIYGSGSMAAELNVKSRLSNLTLYNLAKADIKGSINAEKVEMGIPSQNITCNIYGGDIRLGSNVNTRDTTIAKGTKMIGVFVKIDSTYIKYDQTLQMAGNDILLSGRNEASLFDTTSRAVKPFKGSFSARRLNVRSIDSISMRIANTRNRFSILPYKGDISIPSLTLTSTTERIMARQGLHFFSIAKGAFNINAHKNDAELKMREARMAKLQDSLQMIYPQIPRDSLFRHWFAQRSGGRITNRLPDDFSEDDYNFKLTDKGILHLLNRWEVNGDMSAATMRLSTPAFPLRTRAQESKVSFNLNEIRVDKSKVLSGRSSFEATGSITGIKGALTRGSRLRVNMAINADTLNFNELAKAAYAGTEFMAKSSAYLDSLQRLSSAEDLEDAVAIESGDTLEKMSLFIIPKNIEANFKMNINYGIYSSIILKHASGEVRSKDRCLQILDFNAQTSAGAMDLNAFYKTKSKEDLSVGFDMQLQDVNVGEFIKLYPQIDSLLPMMKSFDGILNSQMAATAQIDTNMNFLLSTVEGVARIKGDSLVLMDGETFAEIAKMMKFKNRDRNLVDSISVELSIKDNKIEVYPFMMVMDRYSTAISGKQDMDMNLDYHISVIKSPLPLRLGIDITGNIDDFKIRPGKVLYKSANLPVYTKFIDSTRVNLREYIYNIHNK